MVFQLDPGSFSRLRIRGAERAVARTGAERRQSRGDGGAAFLRSSALIVAVALTGALTFAPFLFASVMDGKAHARISVLLLGVCAAFAYGVGFEPKGPRLRAGWALGVWTLLALGAAMIVFDI